MQWLRAVVLLAILLEASEARPKADADLATSDRSVGGSHVEQSTEYDVKKSSLADSIQQVTDQLITTPRDVTNASVVNSTLVLEDVPQDEGKANEEIVVKEDEGHKGVAVPLTMKDLEREMAAMDIRLKESSTPKVGISTWILLSESGSTVSPDLKGPTYEIGSESKATTDPVNAVVSKEVNVETPKVISGKTPAKNNTHRKKQSSKEDSKPKKRTTTTSAPLEDTTEARLKDEVTTRQTPSLESTTFLILEPKDADFDLPQDRSPNLHKKTKVSTKSPNKPQQKKKPNNRNKKKPLDEASAKPANNKPAQKDKPISTKIYNYLSREVMPTVGVSLVGLVVTAGIASYLLGGPFGALRRSYDVDRKDDVYFNNNEEYAGPDGQFEEEWLTKVMAGSPSYRNSIRYHSYRPVQTHNQQPYHGYTAYKYPQYSRYRTTGHHPLVQYNPHQQPHPQQAHPQSASNYQAYKAYSPMSSNPPAQMELRNTQKSISGSVAYMPNEMPVKTHMNPIAGETVSELKASQSITVGSESDAPVEKDNVLQHRSQFVVGSVINDQSEDTMPVPEHGPRRRRNARDERDSRGINDNEVDDDFNEVEGNKETATNAETPEITDTTAPVDVISTTENLGGVPAEDTGFFDLVRRLIDLKIRFGLSFLQNATATFQRYLSGVQERIDSSPTFTY